MGASNRGWAGRVAANSETRGRGSWLGRLHVEKGGQQEDHWTWRAHADIINSSGQVLIRSDLVTMAASPSPIPHLKP
jgi:hypothetical protein